MCYLHYIRFLEDIQVKELTVHFYQLLFRLEVLQ